MSGLRSMCTGACTGPWALPTRRPASDKPPCCDEGGGPPEYELIAEGIEAAALAFRRRRPQPT